MTDTTPAASPSPTTLDAFNLEPASSLRPRLLTCLHVDRWADDVQAGEQSRTKRGRRLEVEGVERRG